jgi:hypothetical protein
MDSPKHEIERKINHHQLAIDVGVGESCPIGGAVLSGDPRECCKNVVRYDRKRQSGICAIPRIGPGCTVGGEELAKITACSGRSQSSPSSRIERG